MMRIVRTVVCVGAVVVALLGSVDTHGAERPANARPGTPGEITSEQRAFFQERILPVLESKCLSCHSTQANRLRGNLNLAKRNGMLSGGDSGPAVIAGDPKQSLLIRALKGQDNVSLMPPRRALPDAVIQDFAEWITMGAPDPRPSGESPSPASSRPSARGGRVGIGQREQRPDGMGQRRMGPGRMRSGGMGQGRMGQGRMGQGRMGQGRMGQGRGGGMRSGGMGQDRGGRMRQGGMGQDRGGGMRQGGMRQGGMGQGRGGGVSILDDIYALDLTETQQSRMREIRQEVASKIQAFTKQELPTGFGAGRGLVIGEKREKLLREAYDKANAMLTPKQKEQLAKLSSASSAAGDTDNSKQVDHDLLTLLARISLPQSESEDSPFERSAENAQRNPIDTHVQAALRAKGIASAPLCSDEVFIRRAYLDVIGAIPTAREVVYFLQDKRPGKRPELIDALLERSEFADYQAMKWCDVLRVKAEFPIKLWPNGAAVYHRWIRDAIRTNMPYDEFVRALLTSSGSNFRTPPVNFYRATRDRDPDALAGAVALSFMGARNTHWSDERRREMAVFFSRIAFKSTQEWKEEIVCWNWEPLDVPNVVFPDGKKAQIPANKDPRQVFADWLIDRENPWFAPSVVNRVWFWLLGRGIVHEPDDVRADNPASNLALLDYLTEELRGSNYDLKHIYRMILNSHTYQQSSIQNVGHSEAEALFAHYPMRRLEAEVLEDALCRIFKVEVGYQSDIPEPFTYIPPRQSTVSLADGSISSPFLKTFGRPSRDRGFELARKYGVTESQRMFFINSTELNDWIQGSWWLRKLPLATGDMDTASIRLLWLSILSRYPTASELQSVKAFYRSKANREIEATQDLVWALISTKEFSCRH